MGKKEYRGEADNAVFSGYTSEKMITSMMAHTIPIYYGNPYVDGLCNPKLLVLVSKFGIVDEFDKYIAKVDLDDKLF